MLYQLGAAYVRNIPLDDEEWKLIFILYFQRLIHAFWSGKYQASLLKNILFHDFSLLGLQAVKQI